ncbi:hypothetical protein KIH86_14705 [Paenibacillus sp. HN-1]|uniref:hypothetical protein n=1 Tax=Paenibacillus TaxID=44249 RepID=UPI001CA9C753|nr:MULTISPECIES: hypothetical protein [Paenibacillus]MBY9080577.1 hypothetical protein [Paenibacillus sp. CGMCC 1.18879]MBY9085478.1 hypothetical protein [Paenibacillus sinensis]
MAGGKLLSECRCTSLPDGPVNGRNKAIACKAARGEHLIGSYDCNQVPGASRR